MCGERNVASFSNARLPQRVCRELDEKLYWSASTQSLGFFGAIFTNLCVPASEVPDSYELGAADFDPLESGAPGVALAQPGSPPALRNSSSRSESACLSFSTSCFLASMSLCVLLMSARLFCSCRSQFRSCEY